MFSLGEKMEFLIGNPFSTPVGQRIERATSAVLSSEDWGLNMEICDIINETDEGPRDAVKAIKRRIVANKNFREIMLSLTVLEACVKNCGHRFHLLVASQEFVEGVLVRSILPKYNAPTSLHDRVLSLIQAWADAFRSSPSLSGVVYVYEDLRKRGLEFPMTDLDALSPIHTPHRSIPENGASEMAPVTAPVQQSQQQAPPPAPAPAPAPAQQSQQQAPPPAPAPAPAPAQQSQQQAPPPAPAPAPAPTQNTLPPTQSRDGPVSISPEQEQKLRGELALVKTNLTVMTEMLNQITPGQSQQDDTQLLLQLYTVCKSMQGRVVELIPRLMDEGLVEELLMVNDDLNNAFIRYERFQRLNKAQSTTTEQQTGLNPSPVPQTLSQPAIINTTSQPAASTQSNQRQGANHILTGVSEEEFDMFAQTRGSSLAEQRKSVRYEDPGAVEGLAGALDTRLQVTGAMDDLDRWLPAERQDQSSVSEGVSSEEFDRFLEERAQVVDHSIPPSTSRPPPQFNRHKDDKSHDQLFTL